MKLSSLLVSHAASLWYPIMLAHAHDIISEAKAAELLGLRIPDYRQKLDNALGAVTNLIESLPSPLTSLLDIMRDRPDLLTPKE